MTCSICLDSFTKELRKRTDCPYCEDAVCRACLQTYLLMDTATEPNCPSCRAAWSPSFLNEQLSAGFRKGSFTRHREKVLLDRERARFPETQEQAAAYKEALEIYAQIEALNLRILRLPELEAYRLSCNRIKATCWRSEKSFREFQETEDFANLYPDIERKKQDLEKVAGPLREQLKLLNKAKTNRRLPFVKRCFGLLPPVLRPRNVIVDVQGDATHIIKKKSHTFVHKCPTESCEGFLDTKWICGLCKTKICENCHEPNKDNELHVCNPDLVESVKAISKEAKPCPKCASQISKIDGCDQMWCTQCQTGFSWNTGKIETNVIHNPHYFQWIRQTGVVPPPNPCADNAVVIRLQQLNVAPNKELINRLFLYLQLFRHFQQVTIPAYRNELQLYEDEEWRRKLRVQRMTNEICDARLSWTLQCKEKKALKSRECLQLLEMYADTGMDILRQIITSDDIKKVYDQLEILFEFTEKASTKLSKTYNCLPLKLNPWLNNGFHG